LSDFEAVQRMLREYGQHAETECDARARYHAMQGDEIAANHWQILRDRIAALRAGASSEH